MAKSFSDVLKPGFERIRALAEIPMGTAPLRKGDCAEVPEAEARRLVRYKLATFATRVKLRKPAIVPGDERVERGVGSVVEVESRIALQAERDGWGEVAPPADVVTIPHALDSTVRVKVLKFRPRPGRTEGPFFSPGMLFNGRWYAAGEEVDLPERVAVQWLNAKVAELAEGEALSRRGAAYLGALAAHPHAEGEPQYEGRFRVPAAV